MEITEKGRLGRKERSRLPARGGQYESSQVGNQMPYASQTDSPRPEGSTVMSADRARALAERLHHGQRGRSGAPLIDHVRRVAASVPRRARVVAWLHETLEHASISEEELLANGLSVAELRALRLLTHDLASRSDTIYLAHIERLARARGPGAEIARNVKRADLTDRTLYPSNRAARWSPPYELGLELLQRAAGLGYTGGPDQHWAAQ